jgi:hypothetical protein
MHCYGASEREQEKKRTHVTLASETHVLKLLRVHMCYSARDNTNSLALCKHRFFISALTPLADPCAIAGFPPPLPPATCTESTKASLCLLICTDGKYVASVLEEVRMRTGGDLKYLLERAHRRASRQHAALPHGSNQHSRSTAVSQRCPGSHRGMKDPGQL